MPSQDRSDRHLMRQRGAGSRDVNNVEFGFKFGAQASRDDRKLMRQRGAGNRDIGNVEFGFSFPTPSQTRRSSRTPQTTRRSINGSSQTPDFTKKAPSSAQSKKDDSVNSYKRRKIQQRSSQTPQPMTEIVQPNSGKRRISRIGGVGSGTRLDVVGVPSLPLPPVQSLKNVVFAANEPHTNHEEVFSAHLIEVPYDEDHLAVSKAQSSAIDNENKENEPTKSNGTYFTTKSRQSSVLARSVGDTRRQTESAPSSAVVPSVERPQTETMGQEIEEDSNVVAGKQTTKGQQISIQRPTSVEKNGSVEDDAASSGRSLKKKRKRKSVVLGARKRRSAEGAQRSSAQQPASGVGAVEENNNVIVQDVNPQEVDEILRSSTTNNDAAHPTKQRLPLLRRSLSGRLQKRRNRLSASVSPSPRMQEDEEDDGTYIEDEASPEPITPAAKKRNKNGTKRSRAAKSTASAESERGSRASQKSFPITTHRITNAEKLPTIVEEDENISESDKDLYQLPLAFCNRPNPNAVDVLAQVCRETIDSTILKLETASTASTSRSENNNKRAALHMFRESLDEQLFDISQAIEHRITSEARLRKSKREKAELQARWIEIKRQRDEMALKADNIRRQNWDNEEESKRQWELSELAHKTELEVDRDQAGEEGLEFQLRDVAGYISSAGGQGGLLNRMKSFNSQLERMALALEGR